MVVTLPAIPEVEMRCSECSLEHLKTWIYHNHGLHGDVHEFFIGHWALGLGQLFQDEFAPNTFGATF